MGGTPLLHDGATPWTDDNRPGDVSRLKAVKKAGGIAVSVYVVGSPGGMRCANKRDVDAARALGLGVLPNWERAADFFRTAGLDDCRAAGREALAACRALGFPDDGTVGVAFSFDYQVPTSGYARATAQLQACGEGLAGRYVPLGYAQSGLIDYWASHGLPGPHWLMASTWGMGYRVDSPHVALVQSHNAAGGWLTTRVPGTDANTLTQPERLLAWWPDGSPYGGDMPLTQADANLVARAVANWDIQNGPGTKALYQAINSTQAAVGSLQTAITAANGLLARVAALQAQVDALSKQVDAFQAAHAPAGTVTVSGNLTLGGGA